MKYRIMQGRDGKFYIQVNDGTGWVTSWQAPFDDKNIADGYLREKRNVTGRIEVVKED